MQSIAFELEKIIDQHRPSLLAIPEQEMAFKPSPVKWSKKELMGHMIDSAQNNIRRFIIAQYEEVPTVVYNQDKWVSAVGYQHWDSSRLVNLWYLLNKEVCEILNNMPPEMYQRQCRTEDLHSIEWLAIDYLKHLLHHLHDVLNLEPVTYR